MSSDGAGGSGGYNKVAALLLAGGLAIMATLIVPRVIRQDDSVPVATVTATAAAAPEPNRPAAATPSNTSPRGAQIADRTALVQGYPADSVVLSVVAFGMPARISATFEREADRYTSGLYISGSGGQHACSPDEQYPEPCIYYWVAHRNAALRLTAGNALAGFWPDLDSLRGPGCNIARTNADATCTLTLGADQQFEATYYGSQSGQGEYRFPVCPTGESRTRASTLSTWVGRCR